MTGYKRNILQSARKLNRQIAALLLHWIIHGRG